MASGDAGRGVAALLLDAEAEIDHQNTGGGDTALMFACLSSNVEVARLLLERGANKGIRAGRGANPNYDAMAAAEKSVRKEELLALLARY